MPTNQQRREAERRRLQRQLEERRAREAARKRFTLIASIVGTLVVVAGVVIGIVVATGGSSKKPNAGSKPSTSPSTSASASPSTSPSTSASASPSAPASTSAAPAPPPPTTPCTGPAKTATATFKGVTVKQATDLKHAPKVTSHGTGTPANLECRDLVVGKGKVATTSSTASVQYVGVLYADGKEFDSSWSRGQAASFPLSGVIAGFKEGIAGSGKVAPMHVGGRRLLVLPPSIAYGAQANGSIPANSSLVFIVDLKSATG